MAAHYCFARFARSRLRVWVSVGGSVYVKCHLCRAFGIEPPRSTTPKGVAEQGGVKRCPSAPPNEQPSLTRAPPERATEPNPSAPSLTRAPERAPCCLDADASTERRATADGGRKGDARKRASKGG